MYNMKYMGKSYELVDVGVGTKGTGYIYLNFHPWIELPTRATADWIELGRSWTEDYSQELIDMVFSLFCQYLDELDLEEYRLHRGEGRFVIGKRNLSKLNQICGDIDEIFDRFGFDVINPYLYEGTDKNYWYVVKSRFHANWHDLHDS